MSLRDSAQKLVSIRTGLGWYLHKAHKARTHHRESFHVEHVTPNKGGSLLHSCEAEHLAQNRVAICEPSQLHAEQGKEPS